MDKQSGFTYVQRDDVQVIYRQLKAGFASNLSITLKRKGGIIIR